MIKKIILSLSLCSITTLLHATPASPQSTERFIEIIDVNKSIQELSTGTTFQELTQQIIEYYSIPPTPENQQRIYNAVQKYYLSDTYKQHFRQSLFKIYNQNLTEEETQQWILFYKTEIGQSILNNKNFEQKVVTTVEQIFPEDAVPSPQAQVKLTQAMEKFLNY